jgi:hypothetical protein
MKLIFVKLCYTHTETKPVAKQTQNPPLVLSTGGMNEASATDKHVIICIEL